MSVRLLQPGQDHGNNVWLGDDNSSQSAPPPTFTEADLAAAEAARDAYYVLNPAELFDTAECILFWPTTPTNMSEQRYNEAAGVWLGNTTVVTVDTDQHYQIVQSISQLAPPTAVAGDLHVVAGLGGTATGAWIGQEGNFARATSPTDWEFIVPHDPGEIVYSQADRASYIREGGEWNQTDRVSGPYQRIVRDVVTRDGINSGDRLTKAQADEIFQRTLNINATWVDTNSRVMPFVSLSGNRYFIWNNDGNDPTNAGANSELVLPAADIGGKVLVLGVSRTSSGGARIVEVYDQAPSNDNRLIPISGSDSNLLGVIDYVVYNLDDRADQANDIHVVPRVEGVFTIELASNLPYRAASIGSSGFSYAAQQVFEASRITNGLVLESYADQMIAGLGVGATFRRTAGRSLPVMFGNGAGFFSNAFADETQPTGNVCEVIIPAAHLRHHQVLELQYGQVTSGGTDRDVRVYLGDPTSGGTKIDPYIGDEAHTNSATSWWRVSATPEADNAVANDLHIVFSRVVVTDFAIHDELPSTTIDGAYVRDQLETLTLDDRLDASAIKNIPAGVNTPVNKSVTFDGTDQLLELVSFADSTGNTSFTRRDIAFSFALIEDGTNRVILVAKVRLIAEVVRASSHLNIYDYVADFPDNTTTSEFRLVYDTTDPAGVFKVVYRSGLNGTYTVGLLNTSTRTLGTDVTFGGLTIITPLGTEVTTSVLDTAPWQAAGISQGSEGGAAFHTVGDVSNSGAYIDFRTSELDMVINDTTIGKFSSVGTRLSAGEYGSWAAPKVDEWPIDAAIFTNQICQQRLTPNDVTLNPSSTVTLSGVDAGGLTAATMTGFDGGHRGLRFGTAGSGGLTLNFANCLFQRITLDVDFGVATSSGGATQDYEVVDESGAQVVAWTILGPDNNVGSSHRFTLEFTSAAGDVQYTIRKRSTGTSQTVYLYNYTMTVHVDEPALEESVVVQQDSPTRGTMMPRIIPTAVTHTQGAMALDALSGDRPIWHDGADWAYLNTTRAGFAPIEQGQFFFAEGNTFASSGWTGSNHQRLIPVQDHQGFPELIRCTQSGGTITIQGPNNTQAFWDIARADGFRTDFRMMFGATFDGSVWVDIEPNNTSWGSNGRFEYNVTVNAGQLQITMVNSGGNTTFDINPDTMYTISMVAGPLADVADILVDGAKVGEVTYGGSGTTDRGTFFFIPPGNPVNDFSFLSITTYALAAADRDITLDRQAIITGLRYNVPNVSAPTNLRVPKGLYDFGTTFSIVNGSTETSTVSGMDDDRQLFGGATTFDVLPQKEVTFTQTAFPRGNVWAVEGGKLVINHNEGSSTGNTLMLKVASDGSVTSRHGNYIGDLTVTRTTTGVYSIVAGSHVWSDADLMVDVVRYPATIPAGGVVPEALWRIALGECFIDVFDNAGNPINDRFQVWLYW